MLLYQDESSFYQSGQVHAMWAEKGSKPILPIYGTYSRKNVFGVINPLTGESHFQFIKKLNADCFIGYLQAIRKVYSSAEKIYIVIDNAPGHRAKKVEKYLRQEPAIRLVKLPPYSPDLNPIEIVWREVKKDVVYNTFYPKMKDFEEALTQSLQDFEGDRVISLCNIEKYSEGGLCSC